MMAEVKIGASGCDRPVLRDLVNHVVPSVATHWHDLGLQLLDPKHENELNIIEADTKNDARKCCRKMFSKWLETDELASWDKVLEALSIVGLGKVSCKLLQDAIMMNTRICDQGRSELQNKQISSHVTSVINWLSDFIKGHYRHIRLKKRREEKDPWLPIANNSYITLALMYHKGLQTRTATAETIFLRTKGDICEISKKLNFQKWTDIAQVFNSQSGIIPNVILIEGHPGIGKTTLVKEICTEWAEGKLLNSDKLV